MEPPTARLDDTGHGQREHRRRGVVDGGLGDHRLRDLRTQPKAIEERDQDGRICGRERGADEQRDRERDGEDRCGDERDDHRGDHDAWQNEQAETDGGARDHADGDAEAAVERISETPRVNTSCAPSPATGFSTRSTPRALQRCLPPAGRP